MTLPSLGLLAAPTLLLAATATGAVLALDGSAAVADVPLREPARPHGPCLLLPADRQPAPVVPLGGVGADQQRILVVVPATTCNTPTLGARVPEA